ncbi:MAG: hypothetical protein H0X25_11575 [Acidobacteriales bacterium]|nr:hypothetical protein [Terriglobales bacterium]
MRKLKISLVALALCVSFTLCLAQSAADQPATVTGTVQVQDGKTVIVSDDGQQTWTVDNPSEVKAQAGKHVQVTGHVDHDKGTIHVTEVQPSDSLKTRHD